MIERDNVTGAVVAERAKRVRELAVTGWLTLPPSVQLLCWIYLGTLLPSWWLSWPEDAWLLVELLPWLLFVSGVAALLDLALRALAREAADEE